MLGRPPSSLIHQMSAQKAANRMRPGQLATWACCGLQAPRNLTDYVFPGLRDVRYRHFLETSRLISYSNTARAQPGTHRTKRSTLFSTGVKVCPQETAKAVITSHQAYYKLRVCQEAIWEAFRIFFDRVPNTEEYGAWVYTCQHENICMDNLARNFSSTQEHLDMVARRVAELGESEGVLDETPEPGKDCTWTQPYIMMPTESAVLIKDLNVIPESLQQYVVEFSVTIVDPVYSELLRDPTSPEYGDIMRELRDKMYHVFEKIPGFKEIHVLGFRAEDVTVRYAVVFNGDTELSDEPDGYETTDVETHRDLNAPKLKHIIVRALEQELSLPLDVKTLSFETVTTVYPGEEHIMNTAENTVHTIVFTAVPPTEESRIQSFLPTVAVIQNSLEASLIAAETYTFVPFITEVLTEAILAEPEQTPLTAAVEEEESSQDVHEKVSEAPDTEVETVPEEEVEHVPPTEENMEGQELSGQLVTTEPAPVVGAVTSEPASQIPDAQAVEVTTTIDLDLPESTEAEVLVSQDDAVQGIQPNSDSLAPTAESDQSPEESNESSGGHSVAPPAPADPENILVQEEWNENGTDPGATELLEEESGSGLPSESDEGPYESTAAPAMRQASTPLMAALNKRKELVVFFSLRVTNMMFTDDLFNKNSPEYKSLENTFLELTQHSGLRNPPNPGASSKSGPKRQTTLASIPLLPYLETNLTGFKALEILSFRNGSVIVNSKMKLNKAVPYNVTEAVHCVLEDFCNATPKQLDIQIDSRSLEVEQADQADPCKFLACNAFSRCVVNGWSGEAECLCDPGYSTVDGQPCQSACALQPDYCLNGGHCEIIPGHGATCRCPVGTYWHYHGERCNELVILPLDPLVIVTCLVGSLCLVIAIIGILIFINKKCIKPLKTVTVVSPDSSTLQDQKS